MFYRCFPSLSRMILFARIVPELQHTGALTDPSGSRPGFRSFFFETTWTGAIRLPILGGSNKAANVWRFWEISLMNSELVGLVIWWPLMFQDCVANNLSNSPAKLENWLLTKAPTSEKADSFTTLWSIVRSSSLAPGFIQSNLIITKATWLKKMCRSWPLDVIY